MPIFFTFRHILIIAACFNLLYLVFSKSVGFLHLMLVRISDKPLYVPTFDFSWVLTDAGFYSLTLAALMMVSLKRTQLVFTHDKFSFTSMDIGHRPIRNLPRYLKFGLFFCAMRFVGILMLFLPIALLQILAEHDMVNSGVLNALPSFLMDSSVALFVIELIVTCFALHVLLKRKYWGKRLCLVKIEA